MEITNSHEAVIYNEMDLEAEMHRYNCKTVSELQDLLYEDYNLLLILNIK